MKILDRKDAINHHKDAINRRLYNNQFFVLTAIHCVSCLNRTVFAQQSPVPNPQFPLYVLLTELTP
ncbi:MAG: hypothetical protein V7L07_03925 [Nostoc sp.]